MGQHWLLLWKRGASSGSLYLKGVCQMNHLSLYEEWGLEERGGDSRWGKGLSTTSDLLAIREFSHSLPSMFVERTMMNFGRGNWTWQGFWSARNKLEKLGAANGKCNRCKGPIAFDTWVFMASLSPHLPIKENYGNVIWVFSTLLELCGLTVPWEGPYQPRWDICIRKDLSSGKVKVEK